MTSRATEAVANSASEPHAGAATLGIGFSWGGWMLGSTAKTLADSTASSAAIAPICADQFQRSADAAVFLTALKAAGRRCLAARRPISACPRHAPLC